MRNVSSPFPSEARWEGGKCVCVGPRLSSFWGVADWEEEREDGESLIPFWEGGGIDWGAEMFEPGITPPTPRKWLG